jgi:glutamate/tyrosine decarboxylase-like PLP-dependent enzyme
MNQDAVFDRLLHCLKDFYAMQDKGSFVKYHPPAELRELLDLEGHEGNRDWEDTFDWINKYLTYSVKTNHPDFVNRMWAGANLPSVIGEIIAAASNTSACTYESAPVSTLLEKYLIGKMLEIVGFERGEGQMTTGSSNGNMIAMLSARNMAGEEVKRRGLFEQPELFAFVSADAHYSMDKAAHIIGIGLDHLINIPVADNGGMDCDALEDAIAEVVESGGIPFFVGATAGTTVRGAYDPLAAMLALRNKYNFWLHVDGAWGGSVVLSSNLREQFLEGIEQVDSFTWDFHKMLGVNLMCNVLLFNNMPNMFYKVCSSGDDSYLFRDDGTSEVHDLGAHSLQCGRRVDSLKWFLDWKFFGQAGYAHRVESFLRLCQEAESYVLQAKELEMVVPRESFNVCFRFKTPPAIDANTFNLELRTHLHQQGLSLVGYGYIDTTLTLRLLITNTALDTIAVERFFQTLITSGNKLLETYTLCS